MGSDSLSLSRWLAVLFWWLAACNAASALVLFQDVTTTAGINYSLPPGPPGLSAYTAAQSGGAAAGDFDNDGWPDLFVTRYWDTPVLYRNNRNGTFADVTAAAFPAGVSGTSSNGAAWGDVDNDGDSDLYVTMINLPNRLYINDGAGHFSDQAALRGASLGPGATSGTSVSMGDYDNDGYLDMYVGEWRLLSNPTPPHTRLLRNRGADGAGFFEDVTEASGAAMGPLSGQTDYGALAFTPRFTDLDRDGHADLLVASDSKSTRLFWNNGDGTFTNGTAAIYDQLGFSDMGLAIGDIDGNGLLDWFTTDIFTSTDPTTGNRLFRNFHSQNTPRQFLESSSFSGVRDAGWGWGTEMFDYDNDKDLDIVATNGFYFSPGQQSDQVRLWANNGVGGVLTAFTDVADQVGMTDTSQGRGLLTFDYDRDGDLDVFVSNNFSAPVLYRNDGGNVSDWLQIKTVGTISNTDGAGAFITVTPDETFPDKKLVREITASSGYLSQSEPIAHFGLGPNSGSIDLITIEWPASGIVQEVRNVSPNQLLTIVEQLPGDFNGDGSVDGADYVVWRKHDGSPDGFNLWRANFGASAGAGSTVPNTTPESATWATLLLGVLAMCAQRRMRGA